MYDFEIHSLFVCSPQTEIHTTVRPSLLHRILMQRSSDDSTTGSSIIACVAPFVNRVLCPVLSCSHTSFSVEISTCLFCFHCWPRSDLCQQTFVRAYLLLSGPGLLLETVTPTRTIVAVRGVVRRDIQLRIDFWQVQAWSMHHYASPP